MAGGEGNGAQANGYAETLIVREASSTVPEPSSVVMIGAGLLGLVGVSRRRKSA